MPQSSIDKRLAEYGAYYRALDANKGLQSELAQVLIVASFLDGQLRNIIEAFLAPNTKHKVLLDGPNAPVGSFSARISLSYSLGLITEREYLSIQAIRQIRNKFAHDLAASFNDDSMTNSFNALAWAALQDKAGNLDRAQILFIASGRLANGLINRADHVTSERRLVKDWPNHRIDAIDDGWDMLDRDASDWEPRDSK